MWLAADYRFGTAGRMGPGYFPKVLASILILLGVVSLVRSLATKGEPLGSLAWKQLALILLACALFAWALPRLGLVVALLALCLVSAAASPKFRFDLKASVGLVALIAFSVGVFVYGLGVPMPLLGAWLEPIYAALTAKY